MIGEGTVKSRCLDNFLQRTYWESPIKTLSMLLDCLLLTSYIATQPDPYLGHVTHPFANRPITVREAARCQGFPDSFKFSTDLNAAQSQVGNAVPVNISYALADEFCKTWVKELGKERLVRSFFF
jgi:site-specific DNA-cytosine methylase